MEGRLLLDVVVGEGPAVLELLPGEDQPLLIRRDPLLVLDLGLDLLHRLGRLGGDGDGLAGECLDEDLHGCLSWGLSWVVVVVWRSGCAVRVLCVCVATRVSVWLFPSSLGFHSPSELRVMRQAGPG